MLELKNIKKKYNAGDSFVHALRGVNLVFRNNEFVSILGQSGCGKTTLLNIIGGLDHASDGDLIINNVSTKNFNDRAWDTYRNHTIGFVFQTYNLIPHQSVLQNVELALALSGISKKERKERAIEALRKVGLESQLKKKPSEMSGGQMQRVAIARALVNNPDIILADEPTGALDSETSVQVMDILKEVAKDKLVIMVTHNPDLAEKYSTRIIRMLDGKIISDSNPVTELEKNVARKELMKKDTKKKVKKASMSLGTSFSLSLKNLFTKKGRTMLTSFAGSIGIIGIALIYAVSQGMTTYIDTVQEETLASYPLTINSNHTDMSSFIQGFMDTATSESDHENDAVYEENMMYAFVNAIINTETKQNDLKSFKAYLESEIAKEDSVLNESVVGVKYTYRLDMNVYTETVDGKIIKSDTEEVAMDIITRYLGASSLSGVTSSMGGGAASMMAMGGGMNLWQEMLTGTDGSLINDMLYNQYDMIYGSWPNSYDEVVVVVDEDNEIDDLTLFALGLKTEEEIQEIVDAVVNKEPLDKSKITKFSYEEICDREYKVILNANCYQYDETTNTYVDLRSTDTGIKYLYDNAVKLRVSGIIRPKEDVLSTMLSGTIGYTYKLTEHVVNEAPNSKALKAQLENEDYDIFTNLPFKSTSNKLTNAEKEERFKSHVENQSTAAKAETYRRIASIPPKEMVENAVNNALSSMNREQMEETLIQGIVSQTGVSEDKIREYVSNMKDEEINEIFATLIEEQFKKMYETQIRAQLASLSDAQLAGMLSMSINNYSEEQCALYYDETLDFSESSYEDNLRELGYVDLSNPSSINLYAKTFESKDLIEEEIAKYNDSVEKEQEIEYTDYVGLMMSSVTTIINAITYVLIAFVAVSLVVSSIMIGVITLISVQERTKEIGILRSLGASKRNVSTMFNAETVLIGFSAGSLGVLITYLLCIPINIILHFLTGINNLSAYLPVEVALILVLISVLLTMVAGIIPSRSAAKKDPVVALRTE